jgi:hypothetical protein
MGNAWYIVPGLEYEIRNKISDKVHTIVMDSGWRPKYMDVDEAFRKLESMLGTHEDKMAILREMEARFYVMEVPTKPVCTAVKKTENPTKRLFTPLDPLKKLKSRSGWMGS